MYLIQSGTVEEKTRGYENQIKHLEAEIEDCRAEMRKLRKEKTLQEF